MCFKVYRFNFKLIMKKCFKTSKVAKNKLKRTIAFKKQKLGINSWVDYKHNEGGTMASIETSYI